MRDAAASARPEVESVASHVNAPVTVVIIEGDDDVREKLRASLEREPGVRVSGCGADASIVSLFSHLVAPTVLLLDATLRDGESLHICTHVRDRFPHVRVAVMGVAAPDDELVDFLRLGVTGFIMRAAPPGQIVTTVRLVAEGDAVLPRALTLALFAHFTGRPAVAPSEMPPESVRLTEREREVIALLGEGLNNRDIALRLHIAIHTVKSHVHNILEKLSLHSRLEVAAYSRTPGRRP